jgi:hypothetical protein
MGSRGGAVSNNLSDFSDECNKNKTCEISRNLQKRDQFCVNCCPKCPVFKGSIIYNLLASNHLIIVRAQKVDSACH